jgi:hypothetical protein
VTTYIWPEGGGGGITELTGDVTAGPGSGSQAASVVALRGVPIANVAPTLDGQVLTWNGTDWVPGSPSQGGSGGGGQTYFLNFAATGTPDGLPIATKQLTISADAVQNILAVPVAGGVGVWTTVAGFITNPNVPGTTTLPAGLWDFNVWATATGTANQVSVRVTVYQYPVGGPAVQLAQSTTLPLFDPTSLVQYVASTILPQTTLATTDRIYTLVEATAPAGPQTINLYLGNVTPSHVHTTLPSIAGTGIVHVINGVVQSPATPVNLAGGTSEVSGILPVANGGTATSTVPTNGQLLIGNGTGYAVSNLTPGSNISITNGAGSITIAATVPAGFDLSFQGENTGTSPLVIGAVYLPAITLAVASRVLLGVVGAGTAELRLVEQATSTVVATWTRTGALTDVALAAPTAALAAGWYVFDLAGSAGGTITRCYGAHLE